MDKVIKYTDEYEIERSLTLPEQPTLCPHCFHDVDFVLEKCVLDTDIKQFTFFIKCKHCHKYSIWAVDNETMKTVSFIPYNLKTDDLPKTIKALSPDCVKIYKQSQLAENSGLNMICGIGYRKALEFLIKDYLSFTYPNEKEIIAKELLMQSIKRIPHAQIQILAERTAWLGNDEAHYVRKHEDRTLDDLKRFLEATIKYIDLELTVNDAQEIPKK